LTTVDGGKHPFQAAGVSGIKGGKLMCETRNEFKSARKSYKAEPAGEQDADSIPEPVKSKTPRSRGEGPRDASVKQTWTVVEGNGPVKRRGRPPRAASVNTK
jgi:hypothetical protein